MQFLRDLFSMSGKAPVKGKVFKANKRQTFPDFSAEGHVIKYVDPNLLVEGQSYAHFKTIADPFSAAPSYAEAWGKVVHIDRENDYYGVPRVQLEMEDGDLITVGGQHINKSILKPIG